MKEELKELLEKYWNADTNEEEEALLRSTIANDSQSDAGLQSYFLLQELYLQQQSPANLQSRIEAATIRKNKTARIIMLRQPIMIAAASVGLIAVVATAVILYFNSVPAGDLYADTFNSPEEAWEAMKTAFIDVSESMDKGNEMLESELFSLGNLEIFEQ
jgi:hypothetical protein